MSGTIPEHLRPLHKLARKAGWTITQTRGSHLRWQTPSGKVLITGSTSNGMGKIKDVSKIRKALRTEASS